MYELVVAMVLLAEEPYFNKVDYLWELFDMDDNHNLCFEELVVITKTLV